MLFSRCFLAHAGSVYKQLLKAKPVGAAGGRSRQWPRTAPPHPAMGSGARGHLFPLLSRGARAVNKSLKCLLFLSPSLLLASSFLPRCIPRWLGCLPALAFGEQGGGHPGATASSMLPCLNRLSQGRSQLVQGLGTGRHLHCIQPEFQFLNGVFVLEGGTAPLAAQALPGSWQHTRQALVIFPLFCQNLSQVPRGNVRQDRAAWGTGWVSCSAGCCASPAPCPPKKIMLLYMTLLPLPAGWRCLSTMLFSVLAPAEGVS